MAELGAELRETGSVLPGNSTAAIFERTLKPGEITEVTIPVRMAWAAVAAATSQTDNLMDHDTVGNDDPATVARFGTYDEATWQPYYQHFKQSTGVVDSEVRMELPTDDPLTEYQRAAFLNLSDSLSSLGSPMNSELFADYFQEWIEATYASKEKVSIGGLDGYIESRVNEARLLGLMMAAVVPKTQRGPNFEQFKRRAVDFAVMNKVLDSLRDLRRDHKNGNTSVEHRVAARGMLGLTLGREAPGIIIRNRRHIVDLGKKAVIATLNNNGRLNKRRVND